MKRPEQGDTGEVSLLDLLRSNYAKEGAEEFFLQEEPAPGETLPDGYVRRFPVQPYRERPGGSGTRLRVIPVLCVLAMLLILLGVILWRSLLR